jgi:hypothetical protein
MLGLALDVAGRLQDKIQLSCEVFVNKAEVCHIVNKTINKKRKESEQEDLKETSDAYIYRDRLAE